MSWTDHFATIYDHSVEMVYKGYRAEVVQALELEAGQRVLDLAGGTGPNLALLQEAVGETGEVIGLEPSSGVAARARARAGDHARILETTAMDPELPSLVGSVDAILVTLGLSVIPEPVANVRALLPLLMSTGRRGGGSTRPPETSQARRRSG